jgi:hypothetical protein
MHECRNWTRPRSSISVNICFEFAVQCLNNVQAFAKIFVIGIKGSERIEVENIKIIFVVAIGTVDSEIQTFLL